MFRCKERPMETMMDLFFYHLVRDYAVENGIPEEKYHLVAADKVVELINEVDKNFGGHPMKPKFKKALKRRLRRIK